MSGTQGERTVKKLYLLAGLVALIYAVASVAVLLKPKAKVEEGGQWRQQVAFAGVSPEEAKRERQEYTDRLVSNVVYEASHNPENFLAYGPSATLGKLDSTVVEKRLAEDEFGEAFQTLRPALETLEETAKFRENARRELQKARQRLAEVDTQACFEKIWAEEERAQGGAVTYPRARELWREEARSSRSYVTDCEDILARNTREYVLHCYRVNMAWYTKEVPLQAKVKAKVVKILRACAE